MKNLRFIIILIIFSISAYAQNKFTPAYENFYQSKATNADSLNWKKQYTKSYIYDDKGNILESMSKNPLSNYKMKEIFEYDDENRILLNQLDAIDTISGSKQLYYKYSYTYSKSGKLLQKISLKPSDGINGRITYTYNNRDSLILAKLEELKDGIWTNTEGTKIEYVKISDSSFVETVSHWQMPLQKYEARDKKVYFYSGNNIVSIDHYMINPYTTDWGLYIRAMYRNYINGNFTEYESFEYEPKRKLSDSLKIKRGTKLTNIVFDPLEYYSYVSAEIYLYDIATKAWGTKY